MITEPPHIPVLLRPMLDNLNCRNGGLFADGTFGAGGYTRAILESSPQNKVIAFDRDPTVMPTVREFQNRFGERFTFIPQCFGTIETALQAVCDSVKLDGFVLDLGVSSMQIDQPERGFSFRFEGPLDMRMSCNGITAEEIVNTFSEQKLADIFYRYGEEKLSRRIAKAIVSARTQKVIKTTSELADIVHHVMPKPRDGSDSAMRTFQALRIFVNDELGELERALDASVRILKPNGRLVVVTFHSLEDRIVKNFMIEHSSLRPNANRHAFMPETDLRTAEFEVLTRKPIKADAQELADNPRAHSAKLRCAVRKENIC